MTPITVARWSTLIDGTPTGVLVADVDLVIVRYGNEHSVLYGRCLHRGALMADGTVIGDNLVCGLHGWDYSYRTGISSYDDSERLHRFASWVDVAADQVVVDVDEIVGWAGEHPQPYDRTAYQGAYQDPHGASEEPFVGDIRELATNGLTKVGHHGPLTAMGVPRDLLPAGTRSRSSRPSSRHVHSSTTRPSAPTSRSVLGRSSRCALSFRFSSLT